MLQGLIGDHNQLHVLAGLAAGAARFNELQRRTGLSPPQVDRSLDKLRDAGLVVAKGLPPEGSRRPVAYALSPKGRRALTVIEELSEISETHLGRKAAEEFREVFSAHS